MSESDEDEKVEKFREVRQKRVKEIRDRKRKRKPESDIEDGEVDSEGEFFVPTNEKSNKPKEDNVDEKSKKEKSKKMAAKEKTKSKAVKKVETPIKMDEIEKSKSVQSESKMSDKTEKKKSEKCESKSSDKIEENLEVEPIVKADIEPPKLLQFLEPIQTIAPEPKKLDPTDYTFSIPSREDAFDMEVNQLQVKH